MQLEVRREQLCKEGQVPSDETLRVALLADLQEIQDSEMQNVAVDMEEKVRVVSPHLTSIKTNVFS